jgi:hypothetical protein
MLSAVAILIERTKTHPEEFANGYSSDYGKWDDVIKEFCLCMTAEEKDALTAAMTEAKRTMFNEAVMKRLVGTQSDDSNSLYSVPPLHKASAEGNLLSQIAKRMGRK